jgi:hypothetical protein
MAQGTKLARELGAGIHADVIDNFKEQLLIVFLKRLGGKVTIPLAEVDDTAQHDFAFRVDPVTKDFYFETRKKS